MRNKDLLSIAKDIQSKMAEGMNLESEYSDNDFYEIIDDCILKEMNNTYLTMDERQEVSLYVFNSTRRYDFLQPLLDDNEISEIMINGTDSVFVEKNGNIVKIETSDISEEKLYNIIQNMVSKANRTINESNPIVDLCLSDGSRVNIVLKPLAVNGPCITIRKFPKEPITMKKLIENNSVSVELAGYLREVVRRKKNILVSGGTSSGKTTLLNVLSECIPVDERIVTIEDSAELQIKSIPNLVSLEVRNKNYEHDNEVNIRKLVKAALRMRPDRIIVGEVRDAAALDMIQALNTGHDGSMSTIHANSAKDSLLRLETMALTSEVVPIEAIRRQIASAINIVIHLDRDGGRRSVKNIIEICSVENGDIVTKEIYTR